MLDEILDYRRLDARLATSGKPTDAQLHAIADAGFGVVINLLPEESDAWNPDEEAILASRGVRHVRIPVRWTAPTLAQVDEFCAWMDRLADQPVYVHCARNMRVSAFVYLWRMRRGFDPAQAAADLHAIWTPDGVWAELLTAALSPALPRTHP